MVSMDNTFQLIASVERVIDVSHEIYCLFNGTHHDVTGHREVVHSYDIPYPYIVQDPYLWPVVSEQPAKNESRYSSQCRLYSSSISNAAMQYLVYVSNSFIKRSPFQLNIRGMVMIDRWLLKFDVKSNKRHRGGQFQVSGVLAPKFWAENERTNSTVPLNISACVGCGCGCGCGVWGVWGTVQKFKNSKFKKKEGWSTHTHTGGPETGDRRLEGTMIEWELKIYWRGFQLSVPRSSPRQVEEWSNKCSNVHVSSLP